MKSPTFEISQPPRSLILHLVELKAERLPVSVIFHRPAVVNGKSTEHELLLDTDPANLLAGGIRKEKLLRVINRFISEPLKLPTQVGRCRAHCLDTDLSATELLGEPIKLTGAYPSQKEPANGSTYIPTAPLVAIKNR
jgi:hypothetical protein